MMQKWCKKVEPLQSYLTHLSYQQEQVSLFYAILPHTNIQLPTVQLHRKTSDTPPTGEQQSQALHSSVVAYVQEEQALVVSLPPSNLRIGELSPAIPRFHYLVDVNQNYSYYW